MRHRDRLLGFILLLTDLILINGGALLAIYLRYWIGLPGRPPVAPPWASLISFLVIMQLILVLTLAANSGYRWPRRWHLPQATAVVLRAMLFVPPLTALALFLLRAGATSTGLVLTPSRFLALVLWVGTPPVLMVNRLLAGRSLRALYRRGHLRQPALIVGTGPAVEALFQRLHANPWLGLALVGYAGRETDALPLPYLGAATAVADIVARHQIQHIWLAAAAVGPQDPPFLFQSEGRRCRWHMLPAAFTTATVTAEADRALLHERIEHERALPTFKVAMLGSRGVPANYGGVERYVDEVGAHLVRRGAAVAVYCHRRFVTTRGQHRGMRLRFVPTWRRKHLETIMHTALASLHVLFHDDEIIHYHALGPSTMAWLPRLLGRRVVVTVQGLDWERAKWGRVARLYLRLGERTASTLPHRTIVVSRKLQHHFQEKQGREPVYIPNGFPPPDHRPARLIKGLGLSRDNYFLFVGRLVPEKGCHLLLDAFAQVKTEKKLVIAGRAHYEDSYLQQLQTAAARQDNVQLVGFVQGETLHELYSNAYVVVHPSELEGLSISLLEAISYHNCLLISDVPENVEVVRDLGYTFHAGSVTHLAQRLQWLVDRPAAVAQVRQRLAAKQDVLMDWHAVAVATERVYHDLLSSA